MLPRCSRRMGKGKAPHAGPCFSVPKQLGTLAKQVQSTVALIRSQYYKSSHSLIEVGRSCGGQGNRTPPAASSRPTLGKRAQYPHWECPPKQRLPTSVI